MWFLSVLVFNFCFRFYLHLSSARHLSVVTAQGTVSIRRGQPESMAAALRPTDRRGGRPWGSTYRALFSLGEPRDEPGISDTTLRKTLSDPYKVTERLFSTST